MAEEGHPLIVLDVPLLYETGLEAAVDAVVVVSAPEDVQRQRVLSRPGMTEDRFAAILSRQVRRGGEGGCQLLQTRAFAASIQGRDSDTNAEGPCMCGYHRP